MRIALLLALVAIGVSIAGCTSEREPTPDQATPPDLESADGVAQFILDSGGIEALDAIDAIQFSFGFYQEGTTRHVAHHLWDRANGRYRVEWPADAADDSVYVGIFRSWPDDGIVYRGGEVVETIGEQGAVAVAERRSINDLYWLIAPMKVFDDGVHRRLASDSTTSSHLALHLSFDRVGLTPGDQYWLFVGRETGLVDRWTFLLQNAETPRTFRWMDYVELDTAGGTLKLSQRKAPTHSGASILTDRISVIETVEEAWFEDVRPRLGRD